MKSNVSRLRVKTWTKDGWKTKVTEPVVTDNPRPYHEIKDNNTNQNYGMYAMLAEINDKIQAGNPSTEVDNLPQNIRRMYEENGPIFLGDYGVYRKLDESEQADIYQEWGLYDEDSDDYVNNNNASDLVFAEQNYIYDRQESILNTAEDDENDILSVMTEAEMSYQVNQSYIENVVKAATSDTEGYRTPKERVDNIEKVYYNTNTISAHEREERFKELFQELCFCKTKKDIWGVPSEELDGTVSFSGGFMEKVREFYNADKDIIKKWSDKAKETAKRDFIKSFRAKRKELGDCNYNEERLRKALYMKFDKEQQSHSIKLGVGVEEVKASPGSQWDIDKTKAYQNLYLTKAQWNALYKMKDILIERIDMDYKNNKNRDSVLQELRNGYVEIKTLEDLRDYVSSAVHRKWKFNKTKIKGTYTDESGKERKIIKSDNAYEFEPSLIDQISIKDEFRWKRGVRQLGKKLEAKKNISRAKQIILQKNSNLKNSKTYQKDLFVINKLQKDFNLQIQA